jgi:hypothetical protein
MHATPPISLNRFRVVLLSEDATELLLEADGEHLALPRFEIPANTRIAEECNNAAANRWGMETFCLATQTVPTGDGSLSYVVMKSFGSREARPHDADWVPVRSLHSRSFADPGDAVFFLAWLEEARNRGPADFFARPQSLESIVEWVTLAAVPLGIHLDGHFRQLNCGPRFSLIRFSTDGPALWFKAVGAPNLHEYCISLATNHLLAGFVPPLIASHSGWSAWLSVEVNGNPLTGASLFCDWQKAAETLAHLQVASFGNALHLIAAGCKDLRPSSLRSVVGPFFDCVTKVMAQQPKPTPPPLTPQEIVALAGHVRAALDELESVDFPSVLGHLDLNGGNILVSKDRCFFLDWAEAAVGHPLLTFQYLLEWRRRIDPNPEAAMMLRSAYMAPWRSFSSRDIALDLPLMPLLAAFAYAAGGLPWRDPDRGSRGRTVAFLRSLVRRMHHEATLWNDRRRTCVP